MRFTFTRPGKLAGVQMSQGVRRSLGGWGANERSEEGQPPRLANPLPGFGGLAGLPGVVEAKWSFWGITSSMQRAAQKLPYKYG